MPMTDTASYEESDGLTPPLSSRVCSTLYFYILCAGQDRKTVKTTVLNNMGIPFLQPFPEHLGIRQAPPTLEDDETEELVFLHP